VGAIRGRGEGGGGINGHVGRGDHHAGGRTLTCVLHDGRRRGRCPHRGVLLFSRGVPGRAVALARPLALHLLVGDGAHVNANLSNVFVCIGPEFLCEHGQLLERSCAVVGQKQMGCDTDGCGEQGGGGQSGLQILKLPYLADVVLGHDAADHRGVRAVGVLLL
jgi:hypothetical protein